MESSASERAREQRAGCVLRWSPLLSPPGLGGSAAITHALGFDNLSQGLKGDGLQHGDLQCLAALPAQTPRPQAVAGHGRAPTHRAALPGCPRGARGRRSPRWAEPCRPQAASSPPCSAGAGFQHSRQLSSSPPRSTIPGTTFTENGSLRKKLNPSEV